MRTFFAVPLPADLRRQLEGMQNDLGKENDPVRWVRSEALHVTLRFIGEIPDSTAATIGRRVAAAPAPVGAFDLEVKGAGCFPASGSPRVLWVGLGDGTRMLTDLFRHLEGILRDLGFPPERRPFTPHLTIGRVRGRAGPGLRSRLSRFQDRDWGRIRVDGFHLMESHLSPAGARYSIVERFPLGGRDG